MVEVEIWMADGLLQLAWCLRFVKDWSASLACAGLPNGDRVEDPSCHMKSQ